MIPPSRLPFADRRRLVAARVRATAIDTLLLAYALACVHYLVARGTGEITDGTSWLRQGVGLLGARPWLFLLTPLAAALWQAGGASLGLTTNRVRTLGPTALPAHQDRRALRALGAALQTSLVLFPAALGVLRAHEGGSAGRFFLLSILLALAFVALALVHPAARGPADLLAGTHSAFGPSRPSASKRPWWLRVNAWFVLLLLGLSFTVATIMTQFRPSELAENVGNTLPLLRNLFDPDWSIVVRVIEKIVETVFLALMASVLALPFAFAISFVGARNLTSGSTGGRIAYVVTRIFMNVIRSIEPLVWVIIFLLWVGVGPDAGMLALFVHSVAALGKLYSESIESIDPGPVEAIQATGANTLQTLRYGVVPQVIPPFLSFTVYRWDINVRMATILGLVGGGGIGQMLITYTQLGAWSKVGTIILFITLVVWAMDWASSKARQRLV